MLHYKQLWWQYREVPQNFHTIPKVQALHVFKYAAKEKEAGKNPPIAEFHPQVLGTGTMFPCKTGHTSNTGKIRDYVAPTHWKTRKIHYLSVLAKTHVLEKIIYKKPTSWNFLSLS